MTEPIAPYQTSTMTPLVPPAERTRIGGLDVLRGLAALAVVLMHYTTNYQRLFGHIHGKPLLFDHRMHDGQPFLALGARGVDLFFIISGFVIFMTLEKTRRPIDFLRSRFARLFPAYWAAIVITFLVLKLFPLAIDNAKYHPSPVRAILNLTMLQEMIGVLHIDAVYWTLQIELCFYFLMFVLFVTGRLKHVEFYLLGVLLVSDVLQKVLPVTAHVLQSHRLLAMAVADFKLFLITGSTGEPHVHIHVFLIGIMLYKLSKKFDAWYLTVVGICLGYSAFREWGVDFLTTLCFTGLVFAAAKGWLAFLENRVLLFLGFISYSLYLTHQNIGYEVISRMEKHGFSPNVSIVAAVLVAVGVATLLAYCVEQPALRLLRGKKKPAGHGFPVITTPSGAGTVAAS